MSVLPDHSSQEARIYALALKGVMRDQNIMLPRCLLDLFFFERLGLGQRECDDDVFVQDLSPYDDGGGGEEV